MVRSFVFPRLDGMMGGGRGGRGTYGGEEGLLAMTFLHDARARR